MFSLFYRLIVILLGFPLLIIPTAYATARNLSELPWGFNKLYGSAEDGWNGNGEQRRYWNGQGWPHSKVFRAIKGNIKALVGI